MISVHDSAKFIAQNAEHVRINSDKVKDLAIEISDEWNQGNLTLGSYSDCKVHPDPSFSNAVDWIFTLDSLNYCFWNDDFDHHWKVTWKNKTYTGYYALCAAVWRSIEEGVDLTDPKVYSKLSCDEVKHILRPDHSPDGKSHELLLLPERAACLKENGSILLNKYGGSFKNCMIEAKNSAVSLLKLIVTEFPSFRDESTFKSRKVSFYKRAQILVADLWLWYQGKDLGHFPDIDQITMFADYRVPQVLEHFGVLEYSEKLQDILQKGGFLSPQSEEEAEIRGCSIEAVERVTDKAREILGVTRLNSHFNSILVDNYLWLYRRKCREFDNKPFFKVRTIYY